MNKFKSLLFFLFLIAVSFAFIGGDCGTNTTEPPPVFVEPPSNVDLIVDAIPDGNSYALVSWDASPDEGQSDFKGYRIITYLLDQNDNIVSTHSNTAVPKNTHITPPINSIARNSKYISYIFSELNDGTKSDSVGTLIYGGIYYDNDGVIDAFSTSQSTKSGYGWNPSAGVGTQYAFTTANASSIDLHMRFQGGLRFYSPDQFPEIGSSGKKTLLSNIGTGQDAFDQTVLEEPGLSVVDVVDEDVYLLKTEQNNYIKVWVKNIDSGTNTVTFEYKVQPIVNLRIVKK